jgi:hypothetical protein
VSARRCHGDDLHRADGEAAKMLVSTINIPTKQTTVPPLKNTHGRRLPTVGV